MAEELRPEPPFGLRGAYEHIWHSRPPNGWSDGQQVGHRTFCGRNYPETELRPDLDGLPEVCSDCTAQVAKRH